MMLVFAVACRKEPTSWETQWELPLVNAEFKIEDWIGDHFLEVDDQGWYQIHWDTLVNLSLDTLIQIPDTSLNLSYALPFQVNVPAGLTLLHQTQSNADWIPEGMQLREMKVSNGKLHYKVWSEVDGDVELKFEVLRASKSGTPLLIDLILPPGSIASPSMVEGDFDLAQYVFDLTGPSGNGFNDWTNDILIRSADAGMGADVHMNDEVRVEMTFEDTRIEKAVGYLGQQSWKIDESLAIGKGMPTGDFHWASANIQWQMINRMGTDLAVNLSNVQFVDANQAICNLANEQLNSWRYLSRAQMDANGTIYPTQLEYDWNDQNSNLAQTIGYWGGDIKVKGDMKLNPMGNVNGFGDYFIPEAFQLKAQVIAPVRFNAKGVTVKKNIPVQIDQDIEGSGIIRLKVSNGFPVEMSLSVLENGQLLGDGTVVSGTLQIDGRTIVPSESSISISCSKEQLTEIQKNGFIAATWLLNTTNYPAMVGFRPEYKASVQMIGDVELTLGGK